MARLLEYDKSWLSIWRPNSCAVEALSYRLRFQALPLILPLLESCTEDRYPLCAATAQVRLADPEGPHRPANFGQAHANLVAKLAASRGDRSQEAEAREAEQLYEKMLRRDLIGPLHEWALASPDPVIRNAGVELANICAVLHEMSPSLQGMLGDRLRHARGADADSVTKLLARYLQLSARFAGLMKSLWHLTKPRRLAR